MGANKVFVRIRRKGVSEKKEPASLIGAGGGWYGRPAFALGRKGRKLLLRGGRNREYTVEREKKTNKWFPARKVQVRILSSKGGSDWRVLGSPRQGKWPTVYHQV